VTISKAEKTRKAAEKEEAQKKYQKDVERRKAQLQARTQWAKENPEEFVLQKLRREDFDAEYNERAILAERAIAVEKALKCGLLLLERKANIRDGLFEEWLDEVWPESRRTAYRWMKAALRLELNPHMKTYLPELARLGKSKMYEFLTLPDDEQIAICEGKGNGEIKNLDDVSAMNVWEMREKIRKGREQSDKDQDKHRSLEAENDRLKEENLTLKIGPKTDREYQEQVAWIQDEITMGIKRLYNMTLRHNTKWQREAGMLAFEYCWKFFCFKHADVRLQAGDYTGDSPDSAIEEALCQPDGVDFRAMIVLEAMEKKQREINAADMGKPQGMEALVDNRIKDLHFSLPGVTDQPQAEGVEDGQDEAE